MRFETLPVKNAGGALLVHSVRAGGRLFKKGRKLGEADIAALEAAGIARVTVVRFEPGDVPENEAATRAAGVLTGDNVRLAAAFTGRANLYAEKAGLLLFDPAAIDEGNLVDEAITVATLPRFAMVAPDDMVATVKIIPFAAREASLAQVEKIFAKARFSVAAFQPMRAALISTFLPGQKESLLDKNRAALEARLLPLGSTLISDNRVPHDAGALSQALRDTGDADLVFVFGASAITDRRDVIPAGVELSGGTVTHFGMPVDPGNLLLLGALNGKPVVGLPSCARSPKFNGFDFVLHRLCAGLPVNARDIMRMGVGGLLSEIPSRPQPRDVESISDNAFRAPRIACLVLAAGTSTRMGANKLLAEVAGRPLVRRTVENALAGSAKPVIVVTGHQASEVQNALKGLDVRFIHNPHFAEGISTSLRAGLAAVPNNADGALVMLGDMPEIAPSLIDRMMAAFGPDDGRAIVVARYGDKRGNPVLWARRFFPEMEKSFGDTGAKHLIGEHDDMVCEIDADETVLTDIDTPEALALLRARAGGQ